MTQITLVGNGRRGKTMTEVELKLKVIEMLVCPVCGYSEYNRSKIPKRFCPLCSKNISTLRT